MGLLTGRVAIVTGASRGIGRVISRVFADEGAAVVCVARTTALVDETAAMIVAAGGHARAVTADLSTEPGAQLTVETAIAAFGRLDCLVNNAGDGGPTKPIEDYSLDAWHATLASCLTTSFLCARAAVPQLIASGGGAIVNVASMAGRRGLPNRAGYCSAKAGQIGLTHGLAGELGRHNITVNAIVPGAVEGERIDRMMAARAALTGASVDEVRRTFLARSPLGRMVTAEDVARTAAFLCSDHARNISGQLVPITAGEPA